MKDALVALCPSRSPVFFFDVHWHWFQKALSCFVNFTINSSFLQQSWHFFCYFPFYFRHYNPDWCLMKSLMKAYWLLVRQILSLAQSSGLTFSELVWRKPFLKAQILVTPNFKGVICDWLTWVISLVSLDEQ